MKGFQTDTGNNVLYLSITQHSICEQSKKPREGFEKVVIQLQNGDELTKYLKRYRFIRGYVTGITYRDTGDKYKVRFQSWQIQITDEDGDQAQLAIDLNSNAGSRFMKLAENIDWKQMVEFQAWHDTKDDKTAFVVKQNGNSVPQKYKQPTEESPNAMLDCPPAVKRERASGKVEYDYTEQEDFLFKKMQNVVIPAVEAANAGRSMANDAPSDTEEDDWSDQF